jgi:flagellar biosynthetic protein FliO
MSLAQQMAGVCGVLAILIATIFLLSKRGLARVNFRIGGSSRARNLEVVERLPLTPQHSLHLVRMADRFLLLSVSPAGCSLLQDSVDLAQFPRPDNIAVASGQK